MTNTQAFEGRLKVSHRRVSEPRMVIQRKDVSPTRFDEELGSWEGYEPEYIGDVIAQAVRGMLDKGPYIPFHGEYIPLAQGTYVRITVEVLDS